MFDYIFLKLNSKQQHKSFPVINYVAGYKRFLWLLTCHITFLLTGKKSQNVEKFVYKKTENAASQTKYLVCFSSKLRKLLTRYFPSDDTAKHRICDVCPVGCFSLPFGPRGITCNFLPVSTFPRKQNSKGQVITCRPVPKMVNITKWSTNCRMFIATCSTVFT